MTESHTTNRATVRALPKKRTLAGAFAGIAAVFSIMALSAPAAATVADLDTAERFLAFDMTNTESAPLFHDVELSTVKTSDVAEMADAAAEQQCLAEGIYYEARSESVRGQKAVAEVIRNRVESRFYPDTVCGVIYQGAERALREGKKNCQFSFACDGSLERWTPVGENWTKAQDIAAIALADGFKTQTRDATHYHTNYVRPYWSRKLKRVNTIGTHKFYVDLPHRRLDRQRAAAVLAP